MYKPREKVLWFAIISRVLILVLQFIFNILCPDHEAVAFRSPQDPYEETSIYDHAVNFLLRGLVRWDSQYFIHIAKYGYTYENTLAFFPLYPMSIYYIAMILTKILFMLNEHSVMVITALTINFICFVKSAVIFYDLSKKVLKDTVIAYKAALLYCINPASIFFSAAYTESMFAYLTFSSMLAYTEGNPYIYLPISLSTLVRSNGLINIGFPIYAWLKNLLTVVIPKFMFECKNYSIKKSLSALLPIFASCFSILNVISLSLVPFILLQIHNYLTFCAYNSAASSIPVHVSRYSLDNNLILSGNKNISWCQNTVPIAYSYIQEKYWNVGFMKYYEFKQIPNFIIAFPILYIMLYCSVKYFIRHKTQLYSLGLIVNIVDKKTSMAQEYPAEMFVFVVHGLFLTLFCILFVHIQVSTRLLASASPLLYWYCAFAMSYKPNFNTERSSQYEIEKNLYSKWNVFFLSQREYTTNDKLILSYFLGYLVIGCFMYSNFLPWT